MIRNPLRKSDEDRKLRVFGKIRIFVTDLLRLWACILQPKAPESGRLDGAVPIFREHPGKY
jgi:hypothetical protein